MSSPPNDWSRIAALLYPETPRNALMGGETSPPNSLLSTWAALNPSHLPTRPSILEEALMTYRGESPANAFTGLSGLAALGAPPAAPFGGTLLGNAIAAAAKRRVFFSFHYQEDINRVNVVRNSWRFRPEDGTQPADWFDHSIWEDAKRSGTAALKRLIHDGMKYSTVTCVLAGAETWTRPWVRYEIAYALSRGNGLLTVHIHGVSCMKSGSGFRGPNPLDYLGLKWGEDGKAYLWENFGGAWRRYPLFTDSVKWPLWLPNVSAANLIRPLSHGAMAYDYALQQGYKNLSVWVQLAADRAGH